jgi:Spermine/spermidine synthase domain
VLESTAAAGVRARGGTYGGLFMVTLSTLMYEIGLTRIFSVTMWYHFAFVAISVALFGMTIGALIVHYWPHRFPDEALRTQLWKYSLLFAVTIPPCFITQLSLPFSPHGNLAGLWSVLATCVIISVPFVFSGIVVALALTRFPERVNRLYAADLIGAAMGCVSLVVLLQYFDGPSAVIAVAALAAVGAGFFALDAGSKPGLWLAIIAVLVFGAFAAFNAYTAHNGRAWLRVVWAKEARETYHLEERWNAFSRVTVDGPPDAPSGIVIDSTAGTALPPDTPGHNALLTGQLSNLAHHVRHDADVLVIGSGGGTDVRSALVFNDKSVTGVEINPLVLHFANDTFGDYTGHLDRDPRVKFVNDEARSYIARTDKQYDIMQISLIDTWAAQGAGAFALSENSLYTTNAWHLFFKRLKPGGILSVTRFYSFPGADNPLEMYRTTALASQALTNLGVKNPRSHILAYKSPINGLGVSLATILVSPEPFTEADRAAVAVQAAQQGYQPVLTPTEAITPLFAELVAPGGPGPAVASVAEDISPPTDNRPFFFQMADLDTFLQGKGFDNSFVTRPVLVLTMLAVVVLLLAFGFIVLPLLFTTKRSEHKGMMPFYSYFTAIGLGFLLIEISQLQRLSIFLGNPTYSLAVVLFSVLLFSGIGSMATERFVKPARPSSYLAPLLVLLGLVVLFGLVTPEILRANDDQTTPMRVAIAVGLLAPLSFGLGMPFVIGMRAAAERGNTPTAFLWGMNGAASVCASVFGVVIAVFFGISAAFWTGAAAYVVAAVAMSVISRSQQTRAPAVDESVPLEVPSPVTV